MRHPWLCALDLGQVADPTALMIAQVTLREWGGVQQPHYAVRHLERFPLGTPYSAMCVHRVGTEQPCGRCPGGVSIGGIVEQVTAYCGRLPVPETWEWRGGLNPPYRMVLDLTGVGRPVWELFQAAGLRPIGVTLTGGERAIEHNWDDYSVPKRVLVGALQVTLQSGRFQVAQRLPEAAALIKEAENFRWKVTPAGQDRYEAWREGHHDDLVLCAATGIWYAELFKPPMRRLHSARQYQAPPSPLARAQREREGRVVSPVRGNPFAVRW